MFPLPPFYYFEIGAFIISLVCLYKFDNRPLRWFIPFLLFMICAELTARYIRKELGQVNTWVFNISIPLEYLFYAFMIGSLCITPRIKQSIFFILAAFGVFALINLFFVQGFYQLDTVTLKVGVCFMILCSGLGIIDIFTNDNHETLAYNPLFWICTGVLFFNAGEFLYLFFMDTFLSKGWDKTAKVFGSINNKLIYILYTCISIAILCSKKPRKKISLH